MDFLYIEKCMRGRAESWVKKDTSTVLFLLMHDFIERRGFSQQVQKTRMSCSVGVLVSINWDPPRVSRMAENLQ